MIINPTDLHAQVKDKFPDYLKVEGRKFEVLGKTEPRIDPTGNRIAFVYRCPDFFPKGKAKRGLYSAIELDINDEIPDSLKIKDLVQQCIDTLEGLALLGKFE